MPTVDLLPASVSQQNIIENLMQLYTHDFSVYWSGTPHGELGDDGRFEPYPLEMYWQDDGHYPLLLQADRHLVGFALVNSVAHSGLPVQHNMAEFFVVRKHRGSGVGGAAAAEIFRRYPGLWEVAVARKNTEALAFWRKVIARQAGVSHLEELTLQTDSWDGPVLRFQCA